MNARISLVAGLSLLLLVAAGCDQGSYQKAGGNQAVGGPVTGILIVAQTIEGDTVDVAHKDVKTWNVVDPTGAKVFGKDQIDAQFAQMKGVLYSRKRNEIIEKGDLHLGKNFKEVRVQEVKVTGEEKNQTVAFVVSGTDAAELRALPNLNTLVRRCMIGILLGKIGQ